MRPLRKRSAHRTRLRRQTQHGRGGVQRMQRRAGIERLRAILLGEFFAACGQNDRGVQVPWHRRFTHVPMALITSGQKRVDPDGAQWLSVVEATGQPRLINDPGEAQTG